MSVQPMATPPRQHLAWLDIVKGAGISMVVLGHINNFGFSHFFVYAFHMPLFFFVSGFLHRVDLQFKSYARKKAVTLLVPYLSFLVVVTLLKVPHFVRGGVTLPRLEHALFLLIWGGKLLLGDYGVFWFLSCLYLTQQGMNYLLGRFTMRVVAVIVGIGLLLSYVNYLVFPGFSLPLDANVVLAAAPFYLAGHLLRGREFMDWRYSLFSMTSAAAVSWFIVRGTPAYLDLKDNTYGIIFLSHILALGCTVGTLQLARAVPSDAIWASVLRKIGLVSLPIMFIHAAILNGPTTFIVRRYGTLFAFIVTLGVSWCLAELMTRTQTTRALFLGSLPDFEKLTASKETAAVVNG